MTRIAPIMPPRGHRITWWWLLTSRQGCRKTTVGLFGGFLFCYNTSKKRKAQQKGCDCALKKGGFSFAWHCLRALCIPPPSVFGNEGCLQLGGEVRSHAAAGFFRGKKWCGLALCARQVCPGHGRKARTRITGANARRWRCPIWTQTEKHRHELWRCESYSAGS